MNAKPAILLAEDEEHVAKLVVFKLGRSGFDVIVARDGREALEKLEERPWQVILLDVMMPHVDGWTVLEALRKNEKTRDVPVVMLTARGGLDDPMQARERGADEYVRKPFDPADLAARVSALAASGRVLKKDA